MDPTKDRLPAVRVKSAHRSGSMIDACGEAEHRSTTHIANLMDDDPESTFCHPRVTVDTMTSPVPFSRVIMSP